MLLLVYEIQRMAHFFPSILRSFLPFPQNLIIFSIFIKKNEILNLLKLIKMEFKVSLKDKEFSNFYIEENTTIREIKDKFRQYCVRLFINKEFELDVFKNDKFDGETLKTVWNDIRDGYIILYEKSFYLPSDIVEKTITTFRNDKSYNGYNSSDLKSWLQKK
jgi:hypothetical protein